MTEPDDLFSFYDRPSNQEIDSLSDRQSIAIATAGRHYLQQRLAGRANDQAAVYAYQKNHIEISRIDITTSFGWDPTKPIVAFYASNWFDWPHQTGMSRFTDFHDWVITTLEAAKKNTSVNWLFKPHPCEALFGGTALADMLTPLGSSPHIALADPIWNNAAVMNAVDALITYHGTSGIEFAGMGKPVMVPDRGKYENCGFVRYAKTREEYVHLLGKHWWQELDLDVVKHRAEIFCGWWFCAPDWQKQFVLLDDSKQWTLYDTIPMLLEMNSDVLQREVQMLREWYDSGEPYFHTYKMKRAENYIETNVSA